MSIHANLNKYRKVTRICKIELVWGVVVGLVAEHLAEVVMEEADRLGSLRHEVEEFARSLRSIRAIVADATVGRLGHDDRVKEWKRQVIYVTYDIENVVDEFLRRVAPKRHRWSALAGYLYGSVCFVRELRARRQIGKEIKRIKAQLHEFNARRKMFSSPADEGGALFCGSTTNASYNNRRLSDPQKMEDSDVVGICRPKGELVKKLLSEDQGIVIISVVALWVWVALSRPYWFLESTRASQQREDSSALLGSPFPK